MTAQPAPVAARASLVVLGLFVLVAVFADLLASPQPLVARIDGRWSVLPALTHGSTNTSSRELGANDWALWAPVRGALRPSDSAAPGAHHWLGTDAQGRDVLAVTIHGVRTLVVATLLLVATALGLGVALGSAAGMGSPLWDAGLARLVEAAGVFPTPLLVVLAILAAPAHGYWVMVLVLGAVRGLEVARLLRAELLIQKRSPSLEASRMLGIAPARLARLWLKRALPIVLVSAAFASAGLVALDAGLTWLGLPADSAVPSWGALLGQPGLGGRWLPALGSVLFTGCLAVLADAAQRRLGGAAGAKPSTVGLAVAADRSR